MKLLWKEVKLIINNVSWANAINKLKDKTGKSITDSETMATIFIDLLVYVANSSCHKILRYLHNRNPHSFSLLP